jgi:hypothetical protein
MNLVVCEPMPLGDEILRASAGHVSCVNALTEIKGPAGDLASRSNPDASLFGGACRVSVPHPLLNGSGG